MKKIITVLMILLISVISFNFGPCQGNVIYYPGILILTSYLGCVFWGYCGGSIGDNMANSSATLTPVARNDGKTLLGSWKGKGKDTYFIVTFKNQGILTVAQHKHIDNSLMKYEKGKYSIEENKIVLDMENGTYSVVQYKIYDHKLKFSEWYDAYESVEVQ